MFEISAVFVYIVVIVTVLAVFIQLCTTTLHYWVLLCTNSPASPQDSNGSLPTYEEAIAQVL